MKKLVKTAKQQFEERLGELNIFNHQSLDLNETFYCGLNSENQFIMLLNDGDANYMESGFIDEYEAVVTSEKFLSAMIERFNEGKREIKPLFDWYASADHEITKSSPLDLRDLFNLGVEEAFYQFEDIYEEVPDVRIITAKEQWENDSTESTIQESEGDTPFKVVISDNSLKFYYYEYGYYCNIYPPLESLRKDEIFIKDVTDRLLEFANYEGVGKLQHWIRFGGEFPLSFGWIFYSEYPRTDVIEYEDKELPQEQTIEKKDFSDRFSSLKSDIIANIGELCENGASIDIEALFESYSIVWIDGAVSYFEDVADFSLMKTLEGHWKYGIEYGHDKGNTYNGRLELLTLESLLHILDSLH